MDLLDYLQDEGTQWAWKRPDPTPDTLGMGNTHWEEEFP